MNKKVAEKYLPTDGKSGYTPQYTKRNGSRFSPKKVVRSFRDLEVYKKSLECSVLVSKYIIPELEEQQYPVVGGMSNCTLSIPLFVAEAHGMRFDNFDKAVSTLEKAMRGCNKMIVYLEQSMGLYEKDLDTALIEDISMRYITVRGKMFRLEKAWRKFQSRPKM